MSRVNSKDNNLTFGAIVLVLACLLMYMSVRWVLMQEESYYSFDGNTVSRITYFISCVGLIFYYVVIKGIGKKVKLEVLFLILYFSLGIMYISVMPLSSTPDETEHMLRSYGIAQGDLVPETNDTGEGGSWVPANITYLWNRGGSTIKDMRDNLRMRASDDLAFMTYSNTALYSPLTYTPQAAGILLGRILCRYPYVWAYMGRIINMVTVGILLFLAIRIAPAGKNIIFVLSLLPINMYECASLSGGPLAYAVSVLLIAYTLWLRYEKQGEMNKKEKAWIYLLLLFCASCKIVYVPFTLMAFAVPRERFGDKKKHAFHIACASVMIFLASFGWVMISSRYLIEYTPGVDSAAQAMYVIMHPFRYLQTIVNTFMQVGEWMVRTFFAGALGYFDVGGNFVMMTVSCINLVYVCASEKINLKGRDGRDILPYIMMFLSALISFLLILTSEYVQWTAYMNPSVDGLQGRYFLPLILPLVLLIKKKGQPTEDRLMPYSRLFICFVNLMTIVTLFIHYA